MELRAHGEILLQQAALEDAETFLRIVGELQVHAGLEVSLQRILAGRPQLKYFEAGMDLKLSNDPEESFRIFQGRLLEQYLAMSTEFHFHVLDANQPIEAQQSLVREIVAARIDLHAFAGTQLAANP